MKVILLCFAVLVSQIQFYSASFMRVQVDPVDGKCPYQGLLIAPGEPVAKREPCKEYSCHKIGLGESEQYEVLVAGCIQPGMSESQEEKCHFEAGDGPYPDCCPYQLVCD